jgi:protein O-GlcNAc transferase
MSVVNLGGYTKDARNEIFAARPCPIQISMMGFAGTLGGGFCDYLLADTVVCPPDMCACEQWRVSDKDIQTLDSSSRIDFDASLDPESMSEDWI